MTTSPLELLSVLQELTVAALELFEPGRPVDQFLERVAERLGCNAALWFVWIEPTVALVGSAGLSRVSAVSALSVEKVPSEWAELVLPYAELAGSSITRWGFELASPGAKPERHGLLLCFEDGARLSPRLRPMVERLVEVLRAVLSHRQVVGDLRESYAALAHAQQTLLQRERLAAVGELSAVVAHEVRNPLGSILNCLRSLGRLPPRSEDEAQLLKIAKDEAGQIERIVTDLLDFAKPGELSLRSQNIEQVVASAIEAAQRAQPWPNAPVVRLEAAPHLAPARVDADLLRQAVINLITNAFQAMPRGGTVTVGLVEELREKRRWLRIDVADQGIGIAEASLPRIFEPFFSTRASGSGLGLAIVKRIVDAHAGEIEVRSNVGSGTTFTLRLPVDPAP